MVKVPDFRIDKFPDVDKSLGPEAAFAPPRAETLWRASAFRFGARGMKSTGEAIYFIKDLKDSFFRQVYGERSMYLSR